MNALMIVVLFMYLMGLWMFCLKQKLLLVVLLSLEYMVLMMFMMIMLMLLSYEYSVYIINSFFSFCCLWSGISFGNFSFNNSLLWEWFFVLDILYCDVQVYFLFSIYDPTFGFNDMWLVYGSVYNKNFMTFLMMLFLVSGGFYSNISMGLGMDLMSYGLMLLKVWICMLMIMASVGISSGKIFDKMLLILVIVLLVFLFMTFSMMSMLGIFFFFFFLS